MSNTMPKESWRLSGSMRKPRRLTPTTPSLSLTGVMETVNSASPSSMVSRSRTLLPCKHSCSALSKAGADPFDRREAKGVPRSRAPSVASNSSTVRL